MRIWLKLILRNKFVIAGSLVLSITWWQEKVTAREVQDKIDVMKFQWQEYFHNDLMHLEYQEWVELMEPNIGRLPDSAYFGYQTTNIANELNALLACIHSLYFLKNELPNTDSINNVIFWRVDTLLRLRAHGRIDSLIYLKHVWDHEFAKSQEQNQLERNVRFRGYNNLKSDLDNKYLWLYILGTLLIVTQKIVDAWRTERESKIDILASQRSSSI